MDRNLHKKLYVAMVAQVPLHAEPNHDLIARKALIALDRYEEFMDEMARADVKRAFEAHGKGKFEWKEQFDKKENV